MENTPTAVFEFSEPVDITSALDRREVEFLKMPESGRLVAILWETVLMIEAVDNSSLEDCEAVVVEIFSPPNGVELTTEWSEETFSRLDDFFRDVTGCIGRRR